MNVSAEIKINNKYVFYGIEYQGCDDGLYLMFHIENDMYVACCINYDCVDFKKMPNYDDICSKFALFIYFKDAVDQHPADEKILYRIAESDQFKSNAPTDPTVRHGIAINRYFFICYEDVHRNVAENKWKFAYTHPHIVYGKNNNKKYEVFTEQNLIVEQGTGSDLMKMMNLAALVMPLGIRYAAQAFFMSHPSLKATDAEIESVARLEMRLQKGDVGGTIGAAYKLSPDIKVLKERKNYPNQREVFEFLIGGLIKSTGRLSKVEEMYLNFFDQCQRIDFNLLSAIHMFFFDLEGIGCNTKDLYYCEYRQLADMDTTGFPPEVLNVHEKFETLLKIIRQY